MMLNKPKIGLYVLSYMYRDFLPWALDSVIAQTRKPDFIIFIDDASVDDSVEIAKLYDKKIKFDKIIVHEHNIGIEDTANEAVKLCKKNGCEFVCGLSADDAFMPTYIEKTEATMSVAPDDAGYVYTWVRRIGDENKIDMHPDWDKDLLFKTPYIHGSALIKIKAWEQVGGFPKGYDREEDWAMYRAMAKVGWRGVLLPEPLLLWRKHRLGCRTQLNSEQRIKAWRLKHKK